MRVGLNRRRPSTATRVSVNVTALAMFLAPLRIAWGATATSEKPSPPSSTGPRRSSERVRPIAVDDLTGTAAAEELWRLFDDDPGTGLQSSKPVHLRMSFGAPITVDAIGAFGGAGGNVAIRGI